MRRPQVQFTIARLMMVIAGSALVVTPFAWIAPGSRVRFLIAVLTVGSMGLIAASPFFIEWLERGEKLRPLARVARKGAQRQNRGLH